MFTQNPCCLCRSRSLKVFVLLVLGCGFNLVYAQDMSEPSDVQATAVDELLAQAAEANDQEHVESDISFEVDMPIRTALSILSQRFNVNIVPSASVGGAISFTKLRNVTFAQAMEDILGTQFVYEKVGPTIRVYSREEYDAMRLDVRHMVPKVFTLYYISAEEAKRMIQPVLSDAASIEASTPAERVGPTDGATLASVAGGDTVADNDRVVVRDYPEKLEEVEALLEELDVRPRQVLVEATIMSVRLTEDTEFGIDWNAIDGVSVTQLQPGVMSSGFTSAGSGMSVGVSSDHFKSFIRALETITDTTLLANPKILAVNKQLGQVYIGKKIGYKDATTVGVGGVSTEGEVKFLETGTKLSFRPYIGNDGYIRMDIFPKDSTGELNSQGVPDETSTELATNIMVKDNQTVIIGGLFRDQVTKTKNQVPVLGNLPILGGLFRSNKDTTTREEMVILLTPHIINSPDELHNQQTVEEVERKHQAAKDAMQPLSRLKQAETQYEKACQSYVQGDLETALKQVTDALNLRPNYPQALRLKEKIFVQSDIQAFESLPRNIKAKAEELVASEE